MGGDSWPLVTCKVLETGDSWAKSTIKHLKTSSQFFSSRSGVCTPAHGKRVICRARAQWLGPTAARTHWEPRGYSKTQKDRKTLSYVVLLVFLSFWGQCSSSLVFFSVECLGLKVMRRRLAEQKTWTEPEPNQNGTLKSCCWVAGLIVVFWANLAWVVWYWYFTVTVCYTTQQNLVFSPRYPRSAVCSLKVKIFIFLIFLCISFPSFPAQRVHCSPFYYPFALSLRFQIWRWVQEWFPPRPWNSHLARWSDTQRESGCDGCAGHLCLLRSVSNAWGRWRQICGAAHGKNPVTPSRTEAASTRASGTMENRTL